MLTQYFILKASEIEYSVVKTDKLQGEPHERVRTPGTGLRIPCLELGFRISVVRRFRIP